MIRENCIPSDDISSAIQDELFVRPVFLTIDDQGSLFAVNRCNAVDPYTVTIDLALVFIRLLRLFGLLTLGYIAFIGQDVNTLVRAVPLDADVKGLQTSRSLW